MKKRIAFALGIILGLLLGLVIFPRFNPAALERKESNGITQPATQTEPTPTLQPRPKYTGRASFYTTEYCQRFNPSCLTASGDVFTDEGYTAACRRDFPLGSRLLVTFEGNSVEVICNDRGSFSEKYGRILDLSPAAFENLAPKSKGVLLVDVEIL